MGQRHVAILGPFPVPHVHHHAVTVDVSDLQVHAFVQAQTAGIDRAQADPIARATYDPQNPAHFGHAEHHGQLLFPTRTYQVERGPLFSERMLEEELDAVQSNSDGTG